MKADPILKFRKIESADFQTCASIYSNAWNATLPKYMRQISVSDLRSQTDGDLTIVATRASQILGFIAIWEPESFVHLLFVDPAQHGKGVGTALVKHVDGIMYDQPLSLKCQRENHVAMRFYQKLGFVEGTETDLNDYGAWVRLIRARSAN